MLYFQRAACEVYAQVAPLILSSPCFANGTWPLRRWAVVSLEGCVVPQLHHAKASGTDTTCLAELQHLCRGPKSSLVCIWASKNSTPPETRYSRGHGQGIERNKQASCKTKPRRILQHLLGDHVDLQLNCRSIKSRTSTASPST